MEPHWPSVIASAAVLVVVAVAHFVATMVVTKRVLARAVRAVSKRLDASEIYLTAAEQHAALLGDWEKQRKEEQERRNREHVRAIYKIVEQVVDKRLRAATQAVVGEVAKVPQETATLVASEAAKVATKLASDSQDGSTKSPAAG